MKPAYRELYLLDTFDYDISIRKKYLQYKYVNVFFFIDHTKI